MWIESKKSLPTALPKFAVALQLFLKVFVPFLRNFQQIDSKFEHGRPIEADPLLP